MSRDLESVAQGLFAGVVAPLVLGGALRPGHAIGVRDARALGARIVLDPDLASKVEAARVRAARRLAPIDTLAPAGGPDWALAAAINDILQSANPEFDAPLRRHAAARILETASAIVEDVAPPADTSAALSRHTWLARLLEVRRTDTSVSWWVGARSFLGEEPPARLRAWPRLRRVTLTTSHHDLLDLSPLAVDRAYLGNAVALLLTRTPLTDVATCTRSEPAFTWTAATLALIAQRAGRTLALRALARLDSAEDVDRALGAATRALLARGPQAMTPGLLRLLGDRAIAATDAREPAAVSPPRPPPVADTVLARGIGAWAARREVAGNETTWSHSQREHLLAALDAVLSSDPNLEKLIGVVR